MAYISYEYSWRSEIRNIASAKDRMEDIIFNQLNLKINDTYKKKEKNKKIWIFFWRKCNEQNLLR